MTVFFQFAQNSPLSNDRMMTLVIAGIHMSITFLSVDVFRMLSLYDLLGIWFMIVFRFASLIVENLSHLGIVSSCILYGGISWNSFLMLMILFRKNSPNCSATLVSHLLLVMDCLLFGPLVDLVICRASWHHLNFL